MIARYIVDTVQSSRCRDPRKITKPISKRSSMAAASGHNRRGQGHKVRIVFQFQTMALAFETMAAEQRETARLATTRRRDAWKKDTELERHLHSTAEVTAVTRTEFEDARRRTSPRWQNCAPVEGHGRGWTTCTRDWR